jgi:Caudovirus prohead serine protease
VPLLDTAYNRELIPGLEQGLYGASFRFKVTREQFDNQPEPSDANPAGLPERSIKELRLFEFGPVTFPAYDEATAGVRSTVSDAVVRSLTDQFVVGEFRRRTRLERMDVEDLDTLAQMIQLGSAYIEDQDETDDQANIPAMENVLSQLAALVPVEAQEVEPLEPDDEQSGGRTKKSDAATSSTSARKADAATPRTSDDPKPTWPHVPQHEWEALLWNR